MKVRPPKGEAGDRVRRRIRVRRPRVRVRPLSGFSINRLVPNVLTLLALCAGMTAIRFAMIGNFQAAVVAIIVAGIFDGLDGRMARLLKSTSRFGAELDSLSDFVSFGAAPAIVLHLWTMSALHGVGWAIVLFFAVCCALRLARFNTELGAEPPPYAAGFFTGVPAPAGAGLAIMPLFMSFEWGDFIIRSPYFNAIWIAGVALLMVSTIPTVSMKGIRIPHQLVLPTLLGIGVLTGLVTTVPWVTLTAVGVVYIASIPVTLAISRRRRLAAEPRKAAPAEPGALAPPPAAPFPLDETRPPPNEWRH
ncbi:MAG TPA: CDP-diacylglycerol--serine O-phosphatidyltransferase [Stellaceae bacterium]|nr:CDP-diacylglycerol--serine O-phosphatidyltransferase [Stellaceae bacterium]